MKASASPGNYVCVSSFDSLSTSASSYYDCSLSVSSVMNLFADHGWQLVSVFHAQVPHTLDALPTPCDIMVFSHSTT